MNIFSPKGFKKNVNLFQRDSNPINDKEQAKDNKEKKVRINLDNQNKNTFNLNKSYRKSNLKTKRTYIQRENPLNFEIQEKLNKSNRSLFNIENNLELPKSSLNVKKYLQKTFIGKKLSPSHVSFTEGNINNNQKDNQSFRSKGNLNQTKINFLNLISPSHNRFYNKNKCTNIFNKE